HRVSAGLAVGTLGHGDRGLDELAHGQIFQNSEVANLDVPRPPARAFEQLVRIGEQNALVESQIDATGVGGDVEERIAGTAGERIAGGYSAVSVVDELRGVRGNFEYQPARG